MKRNLFTLTELLVSIGIIVILAAILVPVVGGAMAKAEVTKTKAGITTLMNAIKQYESTYHKLPLPKDYEENDIIGNGSSSSSGDDGKSYNRYVWLIELLQGSESPSNGGTYGTQAEKNPRKIQFLEIQGNNPGEFKDAWDNNFRIVMDKNYKGKLIEPNIPGLSDNDWKKESSKAVLYYDVVIWSVGPDGEFEAGSTDSKRSKVENEDNVYSFNTGWNKDEGHHVQR